MKSENTAHTGIQRSIAGLISLAAFGALALQTTINDGSVLENFGGMARFFTIWGNIAACLVMGWIASGARVTRGVMAALATALAVIALVYWAVLSGDHHPEGLDRVTNQFHHTIIPAAFIAWWLAYTPPAQKISALIPAIMVPPLSYGAFAFVLGEFTGFYAYFFLDLPSLGWVNFLISNAVLAVFFALMGALLLAIKGFIDRRKGIEAANAEAAG
ncbi:MAG: Pr6Pr family membrane protein [Pseudomonadota bacterium]|nr:Pr6Pr family membrane protein [Pseudomonadota bacterium]